MCSQISSSVVSLMIITEIVQASCDVGLIVYAYMHSLAHLQKVLSLAFLFEL